MALAITYSRACRGIDAPLVSVETHLSGGLPAFTIVGLPETAVKESRDRVRSAIINSHFEFPNRRITINLAPADLPKEGSRFDLAIAIGILAASGQLPKDGLAGYEFIAELALSGELRYVNGLLPAMIHGDPARDCVIASGNRTEATLPVKMKAIAAEHILEVCAHLNGNRQLPHCEQQPPATTAEQQLPDLADVAGQPQAKRALEIAAAGGHNLLMSGPPGTGKTMLANRITGILPPLGRDAAIEVASIQSLAGRRIDSSNWRLRPFRQPHHTASAVAMVGGGSHPRPGEISLSHRGILFLDELPEFDRKVLEVLREPIESGRITISRAAQSVEYPAQFQLIAAMNPCPCGFYGDAQQNCSCSNAQIRRYRSKLSGPLLDRIDLHVSVNRLPTHLLGKKTQHSGEASNVVAARVKAAQRIQYKRQRCLNAQLPASMLVNAERVEPDALEWLGRAIEKLGGSARSYHRLLKIAWTIGDLEGEETRVGVRHVKEALVFRRNK